jgi:hypothetical protein
MGRSRGRFCFPVVLFAGLSLVSGCGDDGGPGPGDLTPPVITAGPAAHEVTARSAEIRWTTNENSISTVFWSADTTAGWQQAADSTLVKSHSVALTGLAPETPYFFSAMSADASGNRSARTAARSFVTFGTLPTLVIDPWEVTAAPGDTLRLAVRALNVQGLFGAAFDIGPSGDFVRFDADTLSAGPFLGQNVHLLFLYDSGAGLLEAAITKLYPASGSDGDGTLAWIRLVAAQPGGGTVGFADGSIELRDSAGSRIEGFDQLVTVESSITVQ